MRPVYLAASLVTMAALLLGGCNGEPSNQPGDDSGASASPSESPGPSPSATPSPEAAPRGARSVSEQTDLYQFEYSYPAAAGNIAELAQLLDARLDSTRSQLADEAAQGRRTARENGFPYNKYSTEIAWKMVGDTPNYLSLAADISTYSGGAHGNYGFASLVWDKQAKKTMKPLSFFVSTAALEQALNQRLCAALDAERARRRPKAHHADERDKQGDAFTACPGLNQATVLLESHHARKFNRIGVEFGPDVAGPYSEGSYKFTFRVDGSVRDAVKPDYRNAFSARN